MSGKACIIKTCTLGHSESKSIPGQSLFVASLEISQTARNLIMPFLPTMYTFRRVSLLCNRY